MKRWILGLLLLWGGHLLCFAQQWQEVVYLKNGSVIKGVVVEQVPGVSLKIRTGDGSLFVCRMDEVEKITKEEQARPAARGALGGKGLRVDYRGFLDVGYTVGVGDYRLGRFELRTSHGCQFCPWMYAGIGVGLDVFFNSYGETALGLPVFADLRTDLLDRWVTPYVDLKIGYSFLDTDGFYLSPTAGVRFGLRHGMGLNIGVGYTMQKVPAYADTYVGPWPVKVNFGGLSFKFGLDF